MRYRIKISRPWQALFSLFGFSADRSYVELDRRGLRLHFGTADERIPLAEIAGVERRSWPYFYGLGAKFGPDGGVSYVGSTDGVVRIDFVKPRPMNVWGPFRASSARCAIVSLENADRFIEELRGRVERTKLLSQLVAILTRLVEDRKGRADGS
jgi:hypothetical protein